MTDHRIAVMSVAALLSTVAMVLLGYGVGRAHAAWLDVRGARRELPHLRRTAWARTRAVAGGVLLLLAAVAVAATAITP
ncbi:hypothetical protein [Spirilliplanes yamanashiensis]|nr:hypothetical protein [Spirilliplanes yamanashiensis]MDP9819455.1 hypothetical protein [Spirilliplanes yamanashiensis]